MVQWEAQVLEPKGLRVSRSFSLSVYLSSEIGKTQEALY